MLKPFGDLVDVSDVEYDVPDRPEGEWERLIEAMHSGNVAKISNSISWYFFEVLPPRRMLGRGTFVFCEGYDLPTVFVSQYGQHGCMQARTDAVPAYAISNEDMQNAWSEHNIREMEKHIRHQLALCDAAILGVEAE